MLNAPSNTPLLIVAQFNDDEEDFLINPTSLSLPSEGISPNEQHPLF